jgi:LysM repeat protein
MARLEREARAWEGKTGSAPAAPEAAPASRPQPGPGQFRVDPGDTLSGIAAQFGWTVQSIIDANPGINPDVIRVDQILNDGRAYAPPAGLPPYCTVDPGDTLGGIAAQYGVTLDYLISKNPGINANLIYPYQRINLR